MSPNQTPRAACTDPSVWSVMVALGFGVAGFVVSRRLFRQTKPAALVQGCLLAVSTFDSIKVEKKRRSLQDSDNEARDLDQTLTVADVKRSTSLNNGCQEKTMKDRDLSTRRRQGLNGSHTKTGGI